jgi:hypothetical protein
MTAADEPYQRTSGREELMNGGDAEGAGVEMTAEERQPDQVVKLIRKLRWIGLESEAKELQDVLGALPSPRRGSVVAAPHSTD